MFLKINSQLQEQIFQGTPNGKKIYLHKKYVFHSCENLWVKKNYDVLMKLSFSIYVHLFDRIRQNVIEAIT